MLRTVHTYTYVYKFPPTANLPTGALWAQGRVKIESHTAISLLEQYTTGDK